MSRQSQPEEMRRFPKYKLLQLRNDLRVWTDYNDDTTEQPYNTRQNNPSEIQDSGIPEYIFIHNNGLQKKIKEK